MTDEQKAREIVALIGNIANRPDLRAVQQRQVEMIEQLVRDTWLAAAKEIAGWEELHVRAFETCPTTDPESTAREHKNTMNLLAVLKRKFRVNAGLETDFAKLLRDRRQKMTQ